MSSMICIFSIKIIQGLVNRDKVRYNARMKYQAAQLEVDERLHEKCAVFGVYGVQDAARIAYYGLWALQHRGQESSGIASGDGKHIYRHAGLGLVAHVYNESDLEMLHGTIAIGHNRYSTSGGRDHYYNQPYLDQNKSFALAHNGNLPLTDTMEDFLISKEIEFKDLNDSGMMTRVISYYLEQSDDIVDAVKQSWPLFQGIFSVCAMTSSKFIAFRDQYGIRPLSLGKLDDGYVVASETCAFDTVGAKFIRDIKPGELIVIDEDGLHSHQIMESKPNLDVFEFVYFARPDSILEGQNVSKVRERYGEQLAKEFPINADVVVPVPDSAIPAALGYARASNIPFEMALIKNRYINRTFIRPTQELRERDVMLKLNPIVDVLKGKRMVLVDDSIVRGTTMRKVAKMLRGIGVKEIHLIISSPPVKFPDFYGINTPNQKDLIASHMTLNEIRDYLGVNSVGYLSFDGMIEATGIPTEKLCTSCFDGRYPSPIGRRMNEITYSDGRPAIHVASSKTNAKQGHAVLS